MKKTKKIFAVLLAMMLIMGMSVRNNILLTVNAENVLNEDTVATVGTGESMVQYTADKLMDAMLASTETNPVVIVKDFETDSNYHIESKYETTGIYINLNGHAITFLQEHAGDAIQIDKDIPVSIYNGTMNSTEQGILGVYGFGEYTNEIEIKDCTLSYLGSNAYRAVLLFETGHAVLDHVTLDGGIETMAHGGMGRDSSLSIRNDVMITKGNISVLNLNIEENAKLSGECSGIRVGGDYAGSFTNNGTLDVNCSLIFSVMGSSSGKITNNGIMKFASLGWQGTPDPYQFENNGTVECTGDVYLFSGMNITNNENATMKIGGSLTLRNLDYNGGNSITNYGTIEVSGSIKNNVTSDGSEPENNIAKITNYGTITASGPIENKGTITNEGTVIVVNSENISGNDISGNGEVKIIHGIEKVEISDLSVPSVGETFDTKATAGDGTQYHITSVKYYESDTEVTNEKAEYNKTYTVKVTVTKAEGYGFFNAPEVTINGGQASVTMNDAETVTLTYTFPATAKAKLTGITTPEPIIGISNGTEKDATSLGLPETVTITTEDGDKTANVTWDVDSSSYDVSSKLLQTFNVSGTITVPEDIDQDNRSLNTTISVTVDAEPEPSTYEVTVNNGTGDGNYAEGETVTITADEATSGQEFDQWTVVSGEVTLADVTSSSTTFTMPASAVEVTATYKDKTTEPEPTEPTEPEPSTYEVTVNNGTGDGNYAEGETVTITADEATSGQEFDQWTVVSGEVTLADVTSSSTTFTMPASTVEVTATYKDKTTDSEPTEPTEQEPTPTAPTYTITTGAEGTHELSTDHTLMIKCDGALDKLVGIYVDDKLVDKTNYTLKSGSTILTFNASYLNTLSVGTHKVKFQYSDGSVETTFVIEKATVKDTTPSNNDEGPKTSDSTSIAWLFIVAVISSAGVFYFARKKKQLG